VDVLVEIATQLGRIADSLDTSVQPAHTADLASGAPVEYPEASVDYVDDEVEWGRENIPQFEERYKRVLEQEAAERIPMEGNSSVLGGSNAEAHRED